MTVSKTKNSKGTVAIENHDGRLRLRWSHAGKRYCLGLGVDYTKINVKAAQQKVSQIELDMVSGNFDTTLSKYEPVLKQKPVKHGAITAIALFEAFLEYKAKSLHRRSLEKYQTTHNYLKNFFGEKLASNISEKNAEDFARKLKKQMQEFTLKERLTIVNACWEWGIQRKLVISNPWCELPVRIKIPPRPLPKPFTKEELTAIFSAFQNHEHYSYYLPFVQFRTWTGTRISEAIGLRWQDIADNFSQIWIGSSLSRGERKATKTNTARVVPCNTRLKNLLISVKPANVEPEDLVFPSPLGVAIRDSEFGKRAWRTCLKNADVEYRSFYILRHTFISHCLEAGISPAAIAEITGHDLEILYKHYAGAVSSIEIPEF